MESVSLKCVVVGDGAVGKTSLLLSFTEKKFDPEYQPTIFDNYSTMMMVKNQPVEFNLWDTAGQEEYDHLRSLSYSQTDVFMIVFSVISRPSFENVKEKWVREVRNFVPGAKIILCGSKSDLRTDERVLERLGERNLEPITPEQGVQLQKEIGAFAYVEVSSKYHTNINLLFEKTALCSDQFTLFIEKRNRNTLIKKRFKYICSRTFSKLFQNKNNN